MRKKVFAVIGIMIIAVMVFTACAANKNEEAANGTADASETVSVSEESTTESATDETTTEMTTQATTAATTQSTTKAQTTTKQSTTAKQTTTKKVTTTQKQTTTQRQTTTAKPTTTVKNVTPQDVQAQANAYIKSRGIKVDSSLTPNTAGWSGKISTRQDFLNDGTTLKHCKGHVDLEIAELGTKVSMYCYYDGTWLYILYL